MPSSWRKLAIAGTAGVVVALAFTAPANACSLGLKMRPVGKCTSANTAQIDWQIANQSSKHISITGFQGIQGISAGQWDKGASWSGTQIVGRGTAKAHINIHIRGEESFNAEFDMSEIDWSACGGGHLPVGSGGCKDKCNPPCQGANCNPPCQGANCTNPCGNGNQTCTHGPAPDDNDNDKAGGSTETATATATKTGAAAPAKGGSSAAKGASSAASDSDSLPVTGANVALMIAGAIVFIGSGVVMFFAARRRRVMFTA